MGVSCWAASLLGRTQLDDVLDVSMRLFVS